jgi:hypothetical protein
MKTWLMAVVCLVLGLAGGLCAAALRVGLPTLSDPLDAMAAYRKAALPESQRPKFVVDQESFDFGQVSGLDEPSHTFKVTNKGTAPLTVRPNSTEIQTCKCQVNSIPVEAIEPGVTADVTISLRAPVQGTEGRFRHVLPLLTNDPDRPRVELALTGENVVPLVAQPDALVLGRVVPDAEQSYQVFLNTIQPAVDVAKVDLLDEATAKFFQVTCGPCPPERLLPNMGSGVVVDVKILPGIPRGPMHQTIRVTTTLEGEKAIEIPVEGEVIGDITVISRRWVSEVDGLYFGRVEQAQGAEGDMDVIVRGDARKEVRVRHVRSVPGYLKVEFNEPVENAAKTAVRWPGKVTIPASSPLDSFQGTESSRAGEIILETDHPDFKEIRVKVSFYVAK